MSRKPPWPPKIQTSPRGKDFVRVTIAGKQERFWLGPTNTPESRAAFARLCAELSAGHVPSSTKRPPDLTVAEIVAQWDATAQARYRPDSREPQEFVYAVAPLLELYGTTEGREFGPKRLKAVRQRMIDSGLSRKVINRRIVRIKTLVKWATEEELIPGAVYQSLQAVRALAPNTAGVVDHPPVPTATWEDVKAVFRHCARLPGCMLLVQWFAGMRSQEVRLLRARDIDRSAPVWVYRPHRHKNLWRGQDRIVTFGPKAQAVLRPWIVRAPSPSAYLFDPRLEPRGRARRDHYADSAYGLAIGRAAERAGVAIRAGSARHGFMRRALAETHDPAGVMAAMGQRSIAAFDHYDGKTNIEAAADVARRTG